MKKISFLLGVSVLLATGIMVSLWLSGRSDESFRPHQTEYGSMKIAYSDVETVEKFPATIKGRQDVDIYPQVSG